MPAPCTKCFDIPIIACRDFSNAIWETVTVSLIPPAGFVLGPDTFDFISSCTAGVTSGAVAIRRAYICNDTESDVVVLFHVSLDFSVASNPSAMSCSSAAFGMSKLSLDGNPGAGLLTGGSVANGGSLTDHNDFSFTETVPAGQTGFIGFYIYANTNCNVSCADPTAAASATGSYSVSKLP